MRQRWFLIRAILITVAVCAVVAYVSEAIFGRVRRKIDSTLVKEIDVKIKRLVPDVERRDKEVEELTRP